MHGTDGVAVARHLLTDDHRVSVRMPHGRRRDREPVDAEHADEGMLMRWYGQWSVTVLASAGFVADRAGAQAVGFSASAAT